MKSNDELTADIAISVTQNMPIMANDLTHRLVHRHLKNAFHIHIFDMCLRYMAHGKLITKVSVSSIKHLSCEKMFLFLPSVPFPSTIYMHIFYDINSEYFSTSKEWNPMEIPEYGNVIFIYCGMSITFNRWFIFRFFFLPMSW